MVPLLVLAGIILYLVFSLAVHNATAATAVALLSTALGSYKLILDVISSLKKGRFALDYIAILAILVSLFTGQYLVAAIIALMLSSGQTLEEYGVSQAKKNLSKLVDRIPNEVTLVNNDKSISKTKISLVKTGQKILVKKGEVVSLDGDLESEGAFIDESSLTGEPYTVEMVMGDLIRSGTVNVGHPIVIKVTKEEQDSTYAKIINLVKNTQEEKSPMVRLADRYSTIFTLVTLTIAAFAYFYSGGNFISVLSVLVIATPCPLILATPIALIGGINAASKRNIVVKKLASVEVLSKVKALIFDKTGTITLGVPAVTKFEVINKKYAPKKVLQIAEAIERNSLHPLAKAVVKFISKQKITKIHATGIEEKIGSGISGKFEGERFGLTKVESGEGMQVGLFQGKTLIAAFKFEDRVRPDSKAVVGKLKMMGIKLFVFTGDKLEATKRIVSKLGKNIEIKAECTPEEKQKGVEQLKKQKIVTAMVGDGVNDAPALALADVGMVFSNEEQTAASEVADVVILGSDFASVYSSISIAKKTITIALQSILFGIGLSIVGMVFASFGYIPPIWGAGLQEAIDVVVIINALRSSHSS